MAQIQAGRFDLNQNIAGSQLIQYRRGKGTEEPQLPQIFGRKPLGKADHQ